MDEIKELKSRAYDLLAMIQQAQQQLEQVNNQIRALAKPDSTLASPATEE